MKNGRSLVSLAQELERQLDSKKDLIVPSALIRHATDEQGYHDEVGDYYRPHVGSHSDR